MPENIMDLYPKGRRIGLTSTIPVEAVYSAGAVPVDLNNIFIESGHARQMVEEAERSGFPQNCCAWVKGLYSAAKEYGITEIIGVGEGDCSQNCSLMDVWESAGLTVYTFNYPKRFSYGVFSDYLHQLCDDIGGDFKMVEDWKVELDRTREVVAAIDRQASEKGNITSGELFDIQLLMSDFAGNPDTCHERVLKLQQAAAERDEQKEKIPLAVAGVPTIISDLWQTIEDAGGRVVYHEVPHQFSLGWGIDKSLPQTFAGYTYGSTAQARVAEIVKQVKRREIRGLIHYVQSFCHRQIHDIILRQELDIPVLTIEADRPGPTDGRTLTRIEAFLEQLAD